MISSWQENAKEVEKRGEREAKNKLVFEHRPAPVTNNVSLSKIFGISLVQRLPDNSSSPMRRRPMRRQTPRGIGILCGTCRMKNGDMYGIIQLSGSSLFWSARRSDQS